MYEEPNFYTARGTVLRGPFTVSQLKLAAHAGLLLDTDLVRQGDSPWAPAAMVSGLFGNAEPGAFRPAVPENARQTVARSGSDKLAIPARRSTDRDANAGLQDWPSGKALPGFSRWPLVGLSILSVLVAAGAAIFWLDFNNKYRQADPTVPRSVASSKAASLPERPVPVPGRGTGVPHGVPGDRADTRPVAPSMPAVETPPDAVKASQPSNDAVETNSRPNDPPGTVQAVRPVPVQVRVKSEPASDVLSLISLDYQLDGRGHERSHEPSPYLQVTEVDDALTREVRSLGMKWEINSWRNAQAEHQKVVISGGIFGITPEEHKNSAEMTPEVVAELERAEKAGELNAIAEPESWLPFLDRVAANELRQITDMPQANANVYLTRCFLTTEQALIWDRAEALAKASVEETGDRQNDIQVACAVPGYDVEITNTTDRELTNVTVTTVVYKNDVPEHSGPADRALRSLVEILAGSGDRDRAFDTGAYQEMSVKFQRAMLALPDRRFVHLKSLPAGAKLRFSFLDYETDVTATHDVSFSVWADGIAIDKQAIPGYDQAVQAIRDKAGRPQQAPPGRRRGRGQAK